MDPLPFDSAELERSDPLRVLAGRNWTKADILVYRCGGVDVAVKDYRGRGFLIRQTLGRWLIARESRAYGEASGLDGLPRFFGRLGRLALATEWVPARPVAELGQAGIDPRVFERAGHILEGLHARGIALGDLHHRDLLLTDDGRVFFVDLATAWAAGQAPRGWRRGLFRRLCSLDRIALARIEARFTGGDPQQAAEAVGGDMIHWHRRGRRLKTLLDRLRGKH